MKALFIDVDGTILDSFAGISATLYAALSQHGHPRPTDEQMARMPGPPLEDTLALWGLDPAQVAEVMATYRSSYDAAGWAQSSIYPGWAEALQAWRAEGFVLATATSKSQGVAAHMLEHHGLAPYLDFIGGADPAAGRRHKAPVIEWVLANTGVAAEDVLMIGDRIHDVEGAAHYGIPTALVGWGYGEAAEQERAAYTAADMAELREVVSRHFAGK